MKTEDYRTTTIVMSCILLWIGMVALYYPSLYFNFINYDEPIVLLSHPNLYNEHSIFSSLKEILFYYYPREEPLILRDITWAIDSYVFGFLNPLGYHLGNVLLNSCNVVLLFIFLFLTTNRFNYSLLIAITFGVLPIHVEPVCWIMGRKDMLVTFFMLIALIVQTIYLKTTDKGNKRIFNLITILAVLAALLSKINAVTFFMALAAHHLFYPFLTGSNPPDSSIDFIGSFKKNALRFLPHVLISLFIFYWYKTIIGTWGVLNAKSASFSMPQIVKLFTFIPLVIGFYLKLIFVPSGYSLHYSWLDTFDSHKGLFIGSSIIITLILLYISTLMFLRRKDLLFYLVVFFFLMIPYFNIIGVGIWAANRYVYFSSFCVLAVAADALLQTVKMKNKSILLFFWICFVIVNIFQTYRHQQIWRSDNSFWTYETRLKDPWILSFIYLSNSFIDMALKEADSKTKTYLYDQAEMTLQQGLKQFEKSGNSSYYQFYYVLGIVAQLRGQSLDAQLQYFNKAYELGQEDVDVIKKNADVYYDKALLSSQAADKEEFAQRSFWFFEQFLQRVENDPPVHRKNLSVLEEYENRFPFLKDKIMEAKSMIVERLKKGVR